MQSSPHRKSLLALTTLPIFFTMRTETNRSSGRDGTAGPPQGYRGAIATADILQKNPKTRNDLRDKYRARAVEMEAGGMQNAAWAHDKSVMIIRGICDYCDAKKNDVWQMYAAAVAAAYTRSLVLSLPQEWFPAGKIQ
jgi:nucleoside phosphorylase